MWSHGPRSSRHRCGGVTHPSPPSEYPPTRTRRPSISDRTHEELSRRSLRPTHHRARVRARGDSTDTPPGRGISPSAGGGVLGRHRERHQRSRETGRLRREWGPTTLGHGRVAEPSRERGWEGQRPARGQHLTIACKRLEIASAHASLRLFPAPDA